MQTVTHASVSHGDVADVPSGNCMATLIHQSRRVAVPAGKAFFQQGTIADSLCIVLAGRVRIQRAHPHAAHPVIIDELGPGDTVGAIEAICGERRSATAVAVVDVTVLEVGISALPTLASAFPDIPARLHRIVEHQRGSRRVVNSYC